MRIGSQEGIMARAQCIVVREHKILMVKHHETDCEYWCLPGGSIEPDELPSEAALRELQEECNLTGRIVRETSIVKYSQNDISYTFFIDIDNQTPLMGYDPELDKESQILSEVKWMSLKEISERDRCFLWAAGLLGIPGFLKEIENWKDVISYPCDS
jgi:ADP-ribose pyrophosphatase YjhB (NUDIX family)